MFPRRTPGASTGLKKEAMTEQAERLLAGKGWLPDVLRTPDITPGTVSA